MGERGWRNIGLGGNAVFLDSVLCLGQQRNLNSNPPTKSFVCCHVGDNVRDVWGERGWVSIGLGGSAVFLHSVCASKKY